VASRGRGTNKKNGREGEEEREGLLFPLARPLSRAQPFSLSLAKNSSENKRILLFQEDADDDADDEDIDEDFIDDVDGMSDDDDDDDFDDDDDEEEDDEADGGWCRSSPPPPSSSFNFDDDLDLDLPPVLARDPNAPRPCSTVLVSGVDALVRGGLRPEDEGPVDGAYDLSGCLHGRGVYRRRAEQEGEPAAADASGSEGAPPRVLWFSRTFNDWDLALHASPNERDVALYGGAAAATTAGERAPQGVPRGSWRLAADLMPEGAAKAVKADAGGYASAPSVSVSCAPVPPPPALGGGGGGGGGGAAASAAAADASAEQRLPAVPATKESGEEARATARPLPPPSLAATTTAAPMGSTKEDAAAAAATAAAAASAAKFATVYARARRARASSLPSAASSSSLSSSSSAAAAAPGEDPPLDGGAGSQQGRRKGSAVLFAFAGAAVLGLVSLSSSRRRRRLRRRGGGGGRGTSATAAAIASSSRRGSGGGGRAGSLAARLLGKGDREY
jgi:hypothetical protein